MTGQHELTGQAIAKLVDGRFLQLDFRAVNRYCSDARVRAGRFGLLFAAAGQKRSGYAGRDRRAAELTSVHVVPHEICFYVSKHRRRDRIFHLIELQFVSANNPKQSFESYCITKSITTIGRASKGHMATIRRATADDAAIVLDLIKSLAVHHGQDEHVRTDEAALLAAGLGDDSGIGALLAEVDGTIAGFLSYTVCYSIWLGASFMQIDDLYVRDEFRERGLGNALMKESRRTCLALGLSRMKWEVERENIAAIRFYERLGATGYDKRLFRWVVD